MAGTGPSSEAAAILAAAIINSLGRKVSMTEVSGIYRDVQYTLYPAAGSGAYKLWKDTFDPDTVYE